jgi:hypothetical protein
MAGGKLADRPLIAFGGGIDLGRARQLGVDFADALVRFGQACGEPSMAGNGAEMKQALSRPLPPAIEQIRGGLLSIVNADLAGGRPSGVSAFLVMVSDDPGALLDLVLAQLPIGKAPAIARDGAFHQVVPANLVPGVPAVQVAVKPKMLVAATEGAGVASAQRATATTGRAPLFVVEYDYGRLMKLGGSALQQAGAGLLPEVAATMGTFGAASMSAYVSDAGVAMSFGCEFKR